LDILFQRNTVSTFATTLHDIQVCGHQLALIFADGLTVKVMFALHGQLVPMDLAVFHQIQTGSYRFPVTWQLAIVLDSISPSATSVVLLFADYNKLAQYCLAMSISSQQSIWGSDRNYDPRDQWEQYQARIQHNLPTLQAFTSHAIIDTLTSNHLFNGFGLNHATEALHHARLHPFQSTSTVFHSPDLTATLLSSLHHIAKGPSDWAKYIPQHPDLSHPFKFNMSAWKYYYSQVNKVYQKTKVFVSMEDYLKLVNDSLLPCTQKVSTSSQRVCLPVYKVWKESKQTKRKVGNFSYTCIHTLPTPVSSIYIYKRSPFLRFLN
jgi:hypothetical protein